jgi:hypothetical protein
MFVCMFPLYIGIPVLPGDWTPKDESPFSPPRVKYAILALEYS